MADLGGIGISFPVAKRFIAYKFWLPRTIFAI